MLTDKRQCELFVAMKIGITDQADRNHFAVCENRCWPAGPQSGIQQMEGIVDKDEPHRENVNPVTFRDIIGQAAQGTPPEEVGSFIQKCTMPATFVKSKN